MNILFDLNHPVDVNYFKNAILKLNRQGHEIFITYRPRGKLKAIIDFELGQFKPIPIGKHYHSFMNKILGQLHRDYEFIKYFKKNDIDLVACFGATSSISAKISGIPFLAFEDDFEYKIPFYHANIFATRHIMPEYIKFSNRRTYKYKGFKELAYLNPRVFTPQIGAIEKLGLNENNYVFIREISNVSLNYKDKNKNIIDLVTYIIKKGKKAVISLEDDSLRDKLKEMCVVLKEPVEDIYSILKYAQFAISSGDTMAREACLLGTPCIYTGGREMVMNNELIEIGVMFKEDNIEDILKRIDFLSDNDIKHNIEEKIKHKIDTEWDDTTEVILKNINDFIK